LDLPASGGFNANGGKKQDRKVPLSMRVKSNQSACQGQADRKVRL